MSSHIRTPCGGKQWAVRFDSWAVRARRQNTEKELGVEDGRREEVHTLSQGDIQRT